MRRCNLFCLSVLLLMVVTCGQSSDSNPLLGLWRVTDVTNLTTGQAEPVGRQYYMFTESHMMIVIAGENRPKIEKALKDMSVDEVMSQQPIGAGFYSYKIEGGKLVRTAILTLSAYYEGRTFTTEYEVDQKSLSIRDSHAADGNLREWKMVRVE